MNILPCEVKGGKAFFAGEMIATENEKAIIPAGKLEIGVRPEFVSLAKKGISADVIKVSDAGRFRIVETRVAENSIRLLVPEDQPIPTGRVNLAFDKAHTRIYVNDWLVGQSR
jgi:glycerol transport system ATP-binding protein